MAGVLARIALLICSSVIHVGAEGNCTNEAALKHQLKNSVANNLLQISSKQGASAEAEIVEKDRAHSHTQDQSKGTSYYLIETGDGGACLRANDFAVAIQAKSTDSSAPGANTPCNTSDDQQKWAISTAHGRCRFCLYTNSDLCLDGDLPARSGYGEVKLKIVSNTARRRRASNANYWLAEGSRRRNARRREVIKIALYWNLGSSGGYSSGASGVKVASNTLKTGVKLNEEPGENFRFWKDGDSNDKLDKSELSDIGCYNAEVSSW